MTFNNFGMYAVAGLAVIGGVMALEGFAPQYITPLVVILLLSMYLVQDKGSNGRVTEEVKKIAALIARG